jgi:glycosyltransferase involved in cell wall biosynthesis
MKISYAITVCNEFIEIQRLLTFLLEHKRPQDEIVIQMDLSLDDLNTQPENKKQVFAYIMKHNEQSNCRVILNPLNNDFAAFKNHLTQQCTGDYIFQIDADEIPAEDLILHLPELLEINPEMDVFLVPRVNTVEGLTPEHIAAWGWNITDTGWVNWPDFQWRIWRNSPEIKWINKVHERLDGFKTWTTLPDVEYFALYHPKTIEKQEKQNSYYNTL